MHYRATLYSRFHHAQRLYAKARTIAKTHGLHACSPTERASRLRESVFMWATGGASSFNWFDATEHEKSNRGGDRVELNTHCDSNEQLLAFLKVTTELADDLEAIFKVETTPDPEEPWKDDFATFRFGCVPCVGLRDRASLWFERYVAEVGLTLNRFQIGETRCFYLQQMLVEPGWPRDKATPDGIAITLEPDRFHLGSFYVDDWVEALPWNHDGVRSVAQVGHVWGLEGDTASARTIHAGLARVCASFGIEPMPISEHHPAYWLLPAIAHPNDTVLWKPPATPQERLDLNTELLAHDPEHAPVDCVRRASLANLGFVRYQRDEFDVLVQMVSNEIVVCVAQPGADFETSPSEEAQAFVAALAHTFGAQAVMLEPWGYDGTDTRWTQATEA